MTVYRDGWRLIKRFGYWHIYDGSGKWRGRKRDKEMAYNEMYHLIGRNA